MRTDGLEHAVRIPCWITDLESFRRWTRTEDYPERGRFSYLSGEIWIEMSPEDLYTHNQVKSEFGIVLGGLLKTDRRGRYFVDRTLLSNESAGLSTEPDGLFVSWESLKSSRARHVRGNEGYIEIEGTPDMTLEVVSKSSVRKDTIVLRELYWQAGVPEYWLVDARGGRLLFDILRRGRSGYLRTPRPSGWVASRVFGKSFKLTRQKDELGNPEYTLLVR
jgi:Uma2 family endonuclease